MRGLKVGLVALVLVGVTLAQGPGGLRPVAASMLKEMRLALFLSALAVYAPTPEDQRLYAQQVVNILEGDGGPHFREIGLGGGTPLPGLIPRVRALISALEGAPEPMGGRALFALRNVGFFLEYALEESLAAVRSGDTREGAEHMRKTFAFIYTAMGTGARPISLEGLQGILRYLPP